MDAYYKTMHLFRRINSLACKVYDSWAIKLICYCLMKNGINIR